MASAATAGLDPRMFFQCEDDLELELLQRVAMKAIEYNKKIRREQAIMIIDTLAQSMGKGRRSSARSRNQSSTG